MTHRFRNWLTRELNVKLRQMIVLDRYALAIVSTVDSVAPLTEAVEFCAIFYIEQCLQSLSSCTARTFCSVQTVGKSAHFFALSKDVFVLFMFFVLFSLPISLSNFIPPVS